MRINQDIIKRIKDNISIVEVIQQYVSLHKKGNNWFGKCPFHNEKTASFCVNESKRMYSCFSCRVHGDVFTFLMNHHNISYSSAILMAAKFANLSSTLINQLNQYNEEENKLQYLYEINQAAHKYFQMFLANKTSNRAIEYLQKRGLDNDIIKQFEIGYAPDDQNLMINLLTNKDNMVPGAKSYKLEELKNAGIVALLDNGEYISFFKNRIIFPIYDQYHQLIGFSGRTLNNENEPKYLNTSKTDIFNKNEVLYNFDKVVKDATNFCVYLVEGFMDVIAMHRAGYKNAVATMGVAFSEKHLDQLKRLPELTSIVMAFDNDNAGLLAMQKTSALIAPHYDLYIIQYLTDKYKDLDELFEHDKELCDKTINNIMLYYDYEIKELLSKTVIRNILDKNHLLKKLVEILEKYRHLEQLQPQIELIAQTLSIDEDTILKSLSSPSKTKTSKPLIKSDSKKYTGDKVELKAAKKHKIEIVEYTQKTELVILECCLLSRDAWDLFFQKAGKFLIPENIAILNVIDNFYTKNKDKDFITLSDVANMTNNPDHITTITSMLVSVANRKLKYAQTKLLDTIDTHLKHIHKFYWDKNINNAMNAKDDAEKQKYQDILDKLMEIKFGKKNK